MGSRAYIAMVEPDGSGRFVYLGHGCYPNDAGQILLEHYQDPDLVDAMIGLGTMDSLGPTLGESLYGNRDNGEDWDYCRPATFKGGTDLFFGTPYIPGPEWLYCWTPDGWLASSAHMRPPDDWIPNLAVMSPDEYQEWFDHNDDPAWVRWRQEAREHQRPQPLVTVIQRYIKHGK